MPYTDLLSADRIVMLVDPGHRDAVLDAAARLLAGAAPEQTLSVAEGLRARERIASTGIGGGVALPHCRSGAFSTATAAFLRLAYPVDFSARDGEPVDLVFAMCVPKDDARRHLQTMAELAERFSDQRFRDSLRNATGIGALRAALVSQRSDNLWSIPAA